MTLINGTCVVIEKQGVLIRGPSGAGKSDLALRLIDAGALLISDDYCETTVDDGSLIVTAPDSIAGKLEVRGYGIVKLPAAKPTAITLVVDLSPESEIERMPESNICVVEDVELRHIILDARSPSAPAKVRLALRTEPEQD
jgi:serine kinase of HPr protein (carbohydrate metabolism regulator)